MVVLVQRPKLEMEALFKSVRGHGESREGMSGSEANRK
jgi:hypothetical protein